MDSPDDQAAREQALSFEGSFIVQAPAGSGKTELLIQRFLNLLGHAHEPEEIVAITFTRKAAGEMRERIIEALRRAAAERTGDGRIEARRLELARGAMDNDRRHGWEIINHPARLQIQTIDALCLSLARQLPFLSGFATPGGILDDAGEAYRRAAADTIRLLGAGDESWRRALRRFLTHVDNDFPRAVGLLASMLASRDQWLRHVGDRRAAPDNLARSWRNIIEAHLRRADALFPDHLKESMTECAGWAAARLSEAGATPEALAWLDGEGFPQPRAEDLTRWWFLASLLVTRDKPRFRQKITNREGFPPKSDAKRAMQALLCELSDQENLPGLLHALQSLPGPCLEEGQIDILDAMATVLKLAVAQLRLIFEETAQVDFVEVTQRANAALGALEDPSDLALKLDYQIRHLLVDEFQDTSIAQYELLALLTQGWAPGDGRTLFLVGDPMQSIYRFREAEVGVFLKVWEEGLGSVPLTPLRLASNFRSAPRIVDWVNRAFGNCFPAVSDVQTGAVAYAGSTPQTADPGGAARVYVHPFIDCGETEWARRLAVLIEQALDRSGDVAVLVRARSHLGALLPALRQRSIPYSGMDITALINEPAVRDLYSLTRALLHPGDRLAWLSLLRAPWCGLSLEDLVAVAGRRQPLLIWDALRESSVRAGVSADGLARIDRFIGAVEGAMAQRGRLTLRQWVRTAWVGLGGPALVESSGIMHAQAYFELLGWHQSGMNLSDETAFKEALQSHWAHAEPRGGAVQIMTIHRAKGLEFDEVFVPALDRATPSEDKHLLLWEELADERGLLLAALPPQGVFEDRHYRYLRTLRAEKAANEDDRLLYVACTRARNRLHLTANLETRDGRVKPPHRGSLLRRIWPGIEANIVPGDGAGGNASQEKGDSMRPEQPLRRTPVDWMPPPCPDALPVAAWPPMNEQPVEFSWAGETARQVGILVHELLQRIAGDGLAAWNEDRIEASLPSWRARLHHIGVPPGEIDGAVQRAADSIRNLLDDEKAAWLLSKEHAQAENEYELNVLVGDRVRRIRVDRTFVDAHGVRWIVDYKTSAHEGGAPDAFLDQEVRRYRDQMDGYADAFRRMGNRRVRLGLYFPLLRGWREWPYSG